MTTPSGQISLNDVNVELGFAGTALITMNDSAVRTLAGVPSGAISMQNLQNKSNRVTASATIAANTTNYTLNTAKASGYSAGKTDMTLTINSGVIVYSTSTGSYALTIDTSWAAGDTVTIINNGTILGKGGEGGGGLWSNGKSDVPATPGFVGGPALIASRAVSINNGSGRIAGGGGGGGGGGYTSAGLLGQGGGGGIGGGAAGLPGGSRYVPPQYTGTLTAATAGTLTSAGVGGTAGTDKNNVPIGGAGGNGGTYGSAGAAGAGTSAKGGGAAGAAVAGNSNITWIATGTRNGAIA